MVLREYEGLLQLPRRAGATVGLGLTLIASVRRRRCDLALLKALGLTHRQLASCVAWQSTVAVAEGVVAGIPSGAAFGRWLWIAFAYQINAVPDATVPALSIVYVGLSALALANLVAVLPGTVASRTPAALVLRAEWIAQSKHTLSDRVPKPMCPAADGGAVASPAAADHHPTLAA